VLDGTTVPDRPGSGNGISPDAHSRLGISVW
jgi:hypothetical protein